MSAKTYSAGTIFLQVVPVFGDTMKKIRREANDLNKAMAADTADALEQGSKEGARRASKVMNDEMVKGARKAADRASDEYAGLFGEKLKRVVSTAEREMSRIDFKTASEESIRNLDLVKKKLAELKDVKIDGEFNSKKIMAEVVALEAALAGLAKDRELDVTANTNGARKQIGRFVKWVEDEIAEVDARLTPTVNTKIAERQMDSFEKKVRAASRKAADHLGDNLDPTLAKIAKRLRDLSDSEFGIDIDPKAAYAELQRLELAIEKVATGRDVDVRIASADAIREIGLLRKAFDSIDGDTLRAKVNVDGTAKSIAELGLLQRFMRSFSREQSGVSRANNDAANSFRAFNALILACVLLLPGLIPLIGALGGALLALGPILAGVGAGLIATIIGFSGISDAVKALSDVQKNAKKDNEAYAKSVRSAAERVSDAERSLARAVEDAKERQSDAARNVARAQEDAARMIESALQRQADAERALADAQRDATRAQEDLREARRQAQQDLDDIADRSRQNALDIRQAQVDLFKAQSEYDAAIADPAATNLEKEQLSINLGNAKERLHELREEEQGLAEDRKKGIKGNEGVQSAQDALTAALERQRDAEIRVGEAAEDVARARVDAAERVSDAIRAQQRAQEDSAEAISDAQRNLRRAQLDYRDAVDDTSSSVDNLNEAMSKLGPAGQAFALYIYSLRGYFREIRDAIQQGMLPGVQSMLESILGKYGPGLVTFAQDMGVVLGDLFREFGVMMTNPMWTEFFGMMAELGPKFMREFGQTSMNWLSIFARILTIAAPWAERFSSALLSMSESALGFLKSEKGTKAWQGFMEYAAEVAPNVLKFFGRLWRAIANLGEALAPLGGFVLAAVDGLLWLIAEADPKLLGAIVTAVLTLTIAFQVMTGGIALATAGMALFATTAAGAFLHPVALAVGAIILIAGVLVILYTQSETFREIVHAVLEAVGAVFVWLWEEILKPIFGAIVWYWKKVAERFSEIWDSELKPVWDAIASAITWVWEKVVKPVFGFLGSYFAAMAKVWVWIWKNVMWPVIDLIGTAIFKVLWKGYVEPAFAFIMWGFEKIGQVMQWHWKHVISPILRALGLNVSGDLVQAFRDGVDAIGALWEGLVDALATPVRFVIETVLNDGLIKAFNKVAEWVGSDTIPDIPVPNFAKKKAASHSGGFGMGGKDGRYATGGVLPGYTPGRDVHSFVSPTGGRLHLSGGEAVMRPEWTRAMGPAYVDYMNRLARQGGPKAVREAMGMRAYKLGGVIPAPGSWNQHTSGYPWATWAGDINVPGDSDYGNLVKAFKDGVVAAVTTLTGSYGKHIRINHPDGSQTLYAHLSDFNVTTGQRVNAGQIIGRVGSTGNSSGPHLHFELKNGHGFTAPEGSEGGSGLPGWLEKIIGKPMDWAKNAFNKAWGFVEEKFGDSPFLDMVSGLGKSLLGPIVDKIMGWFADDNDSDSQGMEGLISTKGVRQIVQASARAYGWAQGEQWNALAEIIRRESSWDPNAQNPDSTAAGLFQKMQSLHGAVEGTVEGQAAWGLDYIKSQYGNPLNALAHHNAEGWYADGGVIGSGLVDNGTMMYDNGGYLPPGLTTVLNLTGKPEPVFTADQWDRMDGGGSGGGFTYAPHFEGSDLTAEDVMDDFLFTYKRIEHGGKYVGARD